MQLHFADDSQEQPVEIYHKLKLYDEADPNNPSTKKPVGYAALLKALHDAPTHQAAMRRTSSGPPCGVPYIDSSPSGRPPGCRQLHCIDSSH